MTSGFVFTCLRVIKIAQRPLPPLAVLLSLLALAVLARVVCGAHTQKGARERKLAAAYS